MTKQNNLKKYYGYNYDSSYDEKPGSKEYRRRKNTNRDINANKCRQLGIVKEWPVFMVVTRDKYGIYDDYFQAIEDTKGMECHICQKNTLLEAMKCIDKYHDYFFGVVGHPREINVKNKLISILI